MLHDASHSKEKISQLQGECATWLAVLNLLKEESNLLKTKLSETLDNNTEKEIVAQAETFNNLIIERDEYIKDITADVKAQEKKLKESQAKNLVDKQRVKQQQKLRNEIAFLEKDFAGMRENFYRKFLKNTAP